jgi:hypothetical protein
MSHTATTAREETLQAAAPTNIQQQSHQPLPPAIRAFVESAYGQPVVCREDPVAFESSSKAARVVL